MGGVFKLQLKWIESETNKTEPIPEPDTGLSPEQRAEDMSRTDRECEPKKHASEKSSVFARASTIQDERIVSSSVEPPVAPEPDTSVSHEQTAEDESCTVRASSVLAPESTIQDKHTVSSSEEPSAKSLPKSGKGIK